MKIRPVARECTLFKLDMEDYGRKRSLNKEIFKLASDIYAPIQTLSC